VEIAVLLLGLVPGYEPRYLYPLLARSLPAAAALGLAAAEAVALAAILSYASAALLGLLARFSERSRAARAVYRRIEAARRRAGALVERYGVLGLAVFVAAPLPATGIYTGALVAALLGLPRRKAFAALAAGGLASITIIAAASSTLTRVLNP
jgi:uncharacterized membrane protein